MHGICAYGNVIPVQMHRNCLFRITSYCKYNIEDRHSEKRWRTVNKITNEWEHYKNFIVNLSIVISSEDYKNSLSDREYGGSVELTYISCLIFNYLFRVHYGNSTDNFDHPIGSIIFLFLVFKHFWRREFWCALKKLSHFETIRC